MHMKHSHITKILGVFLFLMVLSFICMTIARAEFTWTKRQETAHQIAELARSLELAEDDPIILRAKELWELDRGVSVKDDPEFPEADVRIIATVIYNEAGNGCTEEHQLLVGRVILNRIADGRFGGDTLYDVICAPRQYLKGYANDNPLYRIPEDKREEFYTLAERVLSGEPYDCPVNVLYQDNLRHGTGVYKQFYSDLLRSTTYFCYG